MEFYNGTHNGRPARSSPWMVFLAAAVVVIVVLAIANQNPATKPTVQQVINLGSATTSGINQPGLVSVTKPIAFTCFDPLAGSNCGAVTIALYQGSSALQLESGTASASGALTTGNSYTTNTPLTLKVSGNSKTTEYLPFTVPPMDPNSALSNANNVVSIYAVTLGAWTVTATGSAGTTFTSGNTYHISAFSGNTLTITTILSETTANAGWKSSYDVTNLLNQYQVIQIDDGAGASSSTQYATVTGAPHTAKSGSTNYYFWACPDGLSGNGYTGAGAFKIQTNSQSAGSADAACQGSMSAQTIGNNLYGGTASFQWTLGLGSLTGGNVETFQIKIEDYSDWNYFLTYGNLGPNAAQIGSTFIIKVTNG